MDKNFYEFYRRTVGAKYDLYLIIPNISKGKILAIKVQILEIKIHIYLIEKSWSKHI